MPIAAGEISGTFQGVLPCADCPGIEYRVDLFTDGVYYLRARYQEREGAFDDIGSWVLSKSGTTLLLKGGREALLFFSWADAGRALVALDTEGNPIQSSHNLELARVSNPSPLEPRLPMKGMFRYMADAALFEECLTGRKLPVAMEGDYAALERAYLEKRAEPGSELLASVEGRIVERVNMEGPARPTLVVERFLSVLPGESCSSRFAAEPFEGTYWKLTELNGTAVVPIERRSEAHVIFDSEGRFAGSDGCNRMFGSYTLEGEKIHFGRVGSTLMACPDGTRDREFVESLGKTLKWRTLGSLLELRSGDDALLARFEAKHGK
jgi:copper homeostasis protein (lipoprotein)